MTIDMSPKIVSRRVLMYSLAFAIFIRRDTCAVCNLCILFLVDHIVYLV